MVPLSALITTRYVASPKLLTRFNGFPAVKITGNPAPGYSSGQAIAAMEEVARETLPGTSPTPGRDRRCRKRSPAAPRRSPSSSA